MPHERGAVCIITVNRFNHQREIRTNNSVMFGGLSFLLSTGAKNEKCCFSSPLYHFTWHRSQLIPHVESSMNNSWVCGRKLDDTGGNHDSEAAVLVSSACCAWAYTALKRVLYVFLSKCSCSGTRTSPIRQDRWFPCYALQVWINPTSQALWIRHFSVCPNKSKNKTHLPLFQTESPVSSVESTCQTTDVSGMLWDQLEANRRYLGEMRKDEQSPYVLAGLLHNRKQVCDTQTIIL